MPVTTTNTANVSNSITTANNTNNPNHTTNSNHHTTIANTANASNSITTASSTNNTNNPNHINSHDHNHTSSHNPQKLDPHTTLDKEIAGILNLSNNGVLDENSNKDPRIVSTQRDLIAGEVSKDWATRYLISPQTIQAHQNGTIHVHDLDYLIQPMFNCCLLNLKDMLDNGTCINGKHIDTPKSFQVACTVTTQIIAQVASGQYGGQSINGIDQILAPYLRKSYQRHLAQAHTEQTDIYNLDPSQPQNQQAARQVAWRRTHKELADGVQTIQYQINTLMTTNGQAPFVTLFLNFDPTNEYAHEAALIQEEILKQRHAGIKNKYGVYVTPAFPKLIYVLDEHNIHPHSPYYYLTQLAAKCSAKRMYPDYISAKKMREIYQNNVFSPMGCRSFLSPWKNPEGKYVFDGRFNMGVVTINLPHIGIKAHQTGENLEDTFWKLLPEHLQLAKQALIERYELLKNITSDVSPIHWQHGAIARLKPQEPIYPLLQNGYATISLGYIGIYELTRLVKGVSHTQPAGKKFALKVMHTLADTVSQWREETGLGFALYGTPAESLTSRFATLDREQFGEIRDITDKGYYTNSYHVDVRENIDAFTKFDFEAEFQNLSTGGMISYVELPNLCHNLEAVETLVKYIYNHITYAEFNTKSDYCGNCGFDGEIILNPDRQWQCPQCGNTSRDSLTVIRRTCGYLGENFWNEGRTKEIAARVTHL